MNESLLRNAYALHQAGRIAEAARIYDEILRTEPNHRDALYLLALSHLQRAEFPAALVCYDRLLAAYPNSADAFAARGTALSNLGRHAEALAAYNSALALKPTLVTAWNHRGNALLELERAREALQSYDRAIALKFDYAEAWRHRGIAAVRIGRLEDALESFGKAIALQPNDTIAREERGNLLMRLHRHAEAVADYDRALAANLGSAELLYNRANAHSILKNYTEAIRDCGRVLAVAPDYPYARGVLVHSKLQSCDWHGLEDEKRKITAALAAGKPVVSPFNLKALSDSPAEHLQCARIWTRRECPPSPPLWRGEHYRHDRIRLAYVSADFNNSAAAALMAGVFEQHDRDRFETIAVSLGPDTPMPMRTRLKAAFDRFLDVGDKSDEDIASLLRGMEADIAVDLMGYTGVCRSRILAARPAPVQANYLGFPGTMGASHIDYILADRTVIPETNVPYYDEKIVYLPHSYQPNDSKRPRPQHALSRAEAGLPENGFVFCSFNNSYKTTVEIFGVWLRLLREIDASVLWLLADNAFAAENLTREAEARGVAAERIIFAPRVAVDDHLARLCLADLFLDTLPYNAHTTASEALWMGLPLVTCMGETFAGRVAASLLNATGLPELITHSLDQYEALALRLAREPETLAAIRLKLARNRDAAPLFDTALYTRNLEKAFTVMWRRAQRRETPASFAVDEMP